MDRVLFEEWVRELDWKFLSVGKSVSLVIDNCPAHHHMENLKSNCFSYHQTPTASTTQPLGQGVIKS